MAIVFAAPVIPVVWDVSSSVPDGGAVTLNAGSGPVMESWWWSPNGDYLYTMDSGTSGVAQFRTLRFPVLTPFDIHTVGGNDQNKFLDPTVIRNTDIPDGLTFSPDGLHMYVCDKGNPVKLHHWVLGVPFNVTSAVSQTLKTVRSGGLMVDIHISPDGTKLVEANGTTNVFNVWTLTTPFFPNGGMTFSNTYTPNQPPNATLFDIWLNAAGTQLLSTSAHSGGVYTVFVYELPTPWDVSSITGVQSSFTTSNIQLGDISVKGVHITPDGTRMHLYATQNNRVYQYDL